MILSDRTMREQIEQGRIRVEPLADGAIQPSSIDLRLGDKIRVFRNNHISHIDLRHDTAALTEVIDLKPGQPFFLRPLEFALGVTLGLPASCSRRSTMPAPRNAGRLPSLTPAGRSGS